VTYVAIVDSGGGNIASLRYALDRLGASSELTTDPRVLRRAPRVILPGVGNASDAMARLRALGLDAVIRELTQPVLGVCLGMQLLFRASEEGASEEGANEEGAGDAGAREAGAGPGAASSTTPTACLGLIDATVRRMHGDRDRPVPHMGWNRVEFEATGKATGLLDGLENGVHMYFVHGYAAPIGPWTRATTSYGTPFSAVVAERNFVGTQFHPERSARGGSRVLANFLRLDPCA
jgi:glutamine amidotransferase